ncbi:MAG: hypothetical protein ACE5JK_06305 [Candidatus Omnitrophota bacterium]
MASLTGVLKEYQEKGIEVYVSVGEKKGYAGKVKTVGDDYVEVAGVTGSRFYNFANIVYVEAALGHKKEKQASDIFGES